jgi:hypothetical protein
MNVYIVLKTYFATKQHAAWAVVLEVFDSYKKAFEYGELIVDTVPGFDTEYTIDIVSRDTK